MYNFQGLKDLKIQKENKQVSINNFTPLRYISSGMQSYNIVVQNEQKQKYLFSFLDAGSFSFGRIEILEKLKNIPHVVQMYDFVKDINVTKINLEKNDEKNFAPVKSRQCIVVYEYIPFSILEPQIFNETLNCIAKSNQMKQDPDPILNLFGKIVTTVHSLHQMHIYHFDLKPENILAEKEDFKIIDFGSAQYLPNKSQNINVCLDQDTRIAFVMQTTELFSPARFDALEGHVLADKFDVFSLGCILYNMLTDDYLPQTLAPNSEQFKFVLENFGIIITDLIAGMTHKNVFHRYSLSQVLQHPALRQIGKQFQNNHGMLIIQEEQDQQQQCLSEDVNEKEMSDNVKSFIDDFQRGEVPQSMKPFFQNEVSFGSPSRVTEFNSIENSADNQPMDAIQDGLIRLNLGQQASLVQLLPQNLLTDLNLLIPQQSYQKRQESYRQYTASLIRYQQNPITRLYKFWVNAIVDDRANYVKIKSKYLLKRSQSCTTYHFIKAKDSLVDDHALNMYNTALKHERLPQYHGCLSQILKHFSELKPIVQPKAHQEVTQNITNIFSYEIAAIYRFANLEMKFRNFNPETAATKQYSRIVSQYNSDSGTDEEMTLSSEDESGESVCSSKSIVQKINIKLSKTALNYRSSVNISKNHSQCDSDKLANSNQSITKSNIKLETLDNLFDDIIGCDQHVSIEQSDDYEYSVDSM